MHTSILRMRKFFWLILFLIIFFSRGSFGQKKGEIGIFGGTAYYMGDINPGRQFYRPAEALGALFRHNFNSRYSLRINAYYLSLSGSDLDFPAVLHPDRPSSPSRFNTSLVDLSARLEFNFRPYKPFVRQWDYTPYISAGFSGSLIVNSDAGAGNFAGIPFGTGIKTTLGTRLAGGLEWTFNKTLNDGIDGLENPSGVVSVMHNNDWYSYLGVFITYKFFNFAVDCPVYER